MIQNRRTVFIGLAALILVAAAFIAYFYGNSNEREPSLSIRHAVKIFADQGIPLNKTSADDAHEINGVQPVTYFIGDTGNKLHIYHYDSIGERKTAADLYKENAGRHFFSTPNNTAKNLLLTIELTDEKDISGKNLEPVGKIFKTVFEKLNDTEEIVFTGSGENWESQTTVKYYGYFYKDENGVLRHESWHSESTVLKYLNDDMQAAGPIAYDYKWSVGGGGSGTGRTLKPDGTVSLGSSGGNGIFPRGEGKLTFTIKWNGREETFIAKNNQVSS